MVVGALAGGIGWNLLVSSYTLTNLVIGLTFLASGIVIAWFRPQNVVGRLFIVAGLGPLLSAAGATLGWYADQAGWPTPLVRALGGTLATGAWQLGVAALSLVVSAGAERGTSILAAIVVATASTRSGCSSRR